MKPYNNNILIIDDKHEELLDEVITPLERLGYTVERQANPSSGLMLATHLYSVIFIDYQFDNSVNHTGESLSHQIRKKSPLSTLILITAYGKEYVSEIGIADLDGYYEKGKEGIRARDLDNLIEQCVEKSVERKYNKTPFLLSIPKEHEKIALKVKLLDDLEELCKKLVEQDRKYNDLGIAKDLEFRNRTTLAIKFTIRNKESLELYKDALMFRHVLMAKENQGKWSTAKKMYKPLRDLIEFFCIS